MKIYLKKLKVCLEAISNPANSWWHFGEPEPKVKTIRTNRNILPTPDSYNIRGKWGKAGDSSRYNPAP
jgi:hypothetical protein